MSLSTKITLLFLLLFALMATCVYKHIDDFSSDTTETPIINKEETITLPASEQSTEEAAIKTAADNIQQLEEQEEVKRDEATPKDVSEKTVELTLTAEVKDESTPTEVKIPVVNAKEIQAQINALLKEKSIIFKRMSYNVTEKSQETIVAIAQIIKTDDTLKYEVAGHTDAKGDESFNQMVSEQRAQSVKQALIDLGIDANRLRAKGYGEAYPIVPNDAKGYSLVNRRVEINIIEE